MERNKEAAARYGLMDSDNWPKVDGLQVAKVKKGHSRRRGVTGHWTPGECRFMSRRQVY